MIAHRMSVILILGRPSRLSWAMSDGAADHAESDPRKHLRVHVVISSSSVATSFYTAARIQPGYRERLAHVTETRGLGSSCVAGIEVFSAGSRNFFRIGFG